MNPNKLRHVVAVDRCGSISQAAAQLNITQSAVTKSVADVERELGYSLFDRLARGVAATLDGRVFIDRARRIIADMDQFVEDSRAKRLERELVLRVVICPASLEGLLNRALRSFIMANPKCRVHMLATTIERGIHLLRQGDVDICIGGQDRLEAINDFECQPLQPLSALLFARRGHPLEGRKRLVNADLADYPIIVPDLQGPYIERLTDFDRSDESMMRRLHIIENFPMVADIVSSTDTIGIVSIGYANTDAFRRRFCTLPFNLGPVMPLAIASRSAWPDTRQAMQFRSALRKYPLTGTSGQI